MKFEFLNDIISNKPLLALIYILSSIIIAYIVDKIFIASLKLLVKRSDTEIDDKILDFIHKPIYYSILFFGISIAIGLLEISSKINFYLIGIMKSIIIVFWAIALFKSFMIFIEWSSKKSRTIPFIQPKTIPLFENMGKIILFLFSIYFVMLSWNIDVTAWIASAGIISVVIGLAAKDTLGNLFSGKGNWQPSPLYAPSAESWSNMVNSRLGSNLRNISWEDIKNLQMNRGPDFTQEHQEGKVYNTPIDQMSPPAYQPDERQPSYNDESSGLRQLSPEEIDQMNSQRNPRVRMELERMVPRRQVRTIWDYLNSLKRNVQ